MEQGYNADVNSQTKVQGNLRSRALSFPTRDPRIRDPGRLTAGPPQKFYESDLAVERLTDTDDLDNELKIPLTVLYKIRPPQRGWVIRNRTISSFVVMVDGTFSPI